MGLKGKSTTTLLYLCRERLEEMPLDSINIADHVCSWNTSVLFMMLNINPPL